jgi:pimeloyl-ACP methyl ester carboxylesterase
MNILCRRAFLPALLLFACAASAQAQQVGVILMHGKWGTPQGPIQATELALKGAGFSVVSKEMPWSDRRAYDAGVDEVMSGLEGEVAKLRAAGARKILVGGQSLGANMALAYAARHPDLDGLIMLSPGHTPERFAGAHGMADSLAKARQLISAGKGRSYANFQDTNQGRTREVSAYPSVYLSYFDPEGPAVMPINAAKLSPHTALLLVVGTKDRILADGTGYIFDRAPRNAYSAFRAIDADHFNAPAESRRIVVDWVKGLP